MVKDETSLTFYGGVNEIGGNKILLQDGDTRIFLDFGLSFGRRSKYYEEFLTPRSACGLGDFLEMDLVPDIEGIYRDDLLAMCGLKQKKQKIDGVFLSHVHADHANYVSLLHEDIPVYLGETALWILNAAAESGTRTLESEIIDFKKRPVEDRKEEPVKRTFKPFRTGEKIKVGSLEIEPVHVDHSIPGAYGFVIHTSRGAMVYTGDLRMHGTKPQMTSEFAERAEEAEPVALVIEGTRIDSEHDVSSEAKVRQECNEAVVETNKFVVADFNFKDVDRLRTFLEIAKNNDRRLVVSLKDAFLLKWLSRDLKLNVPNYDNENIVIHIPKRGTGRFRESDYSVAERQFLKLGNAWTAETVRKNQKRVVSVLSFYNFNELIDIKPEPDGLFIHSLSEPFNEEMEFDSKRLNNWLRHFELRKFQSHCSGHACGKELLDMARRINAKKVFPIHTEHPQIFRKALKNVQIVREAVEYEL
jgi:ribonuclease J